MWVLFGGKKAACVAAREGTKQEKGGGTPGELEPRLAYEKKFRDGLRSIGLQIGKEVVLESLAKTCIAENVL